jgi:uncharacterized protein (DUF1330 family)
MKGRVIRDFRVTSRMQSPDRTKTMTSTPPSGTPASQQTDTPAAYAIGHITVRDDAKWREYCRQVPATLAPWHGKVLLRGQLLEILNGAHAHGDTVVLRFPDQQALAEWHASPAYQALIPLRDAGADVVLLAFAG